MMEAKGIVALFVVFFFFYFLTWEIWRLQRRKQVLEIQRKLRLQYSHWVQACYCSHYCHYFHDVYHCHPCRMGRDEEEDGCQPYLLKDHALYSQQSLKNKINTWLSQYALQQFNAFHKFSCDNILIFKKQRKYFKWSKVKILIQLTTYARVAPQTNV